MDLNPYESPRAATEVSPAGRLQKVGCFFFVAVGGLFVLSLVGETIFALMFPAEPEREPYFEPIPVNQSAK